ncbi:MAG: ABC transporter ATP-binding protein [Firmicutes bacterium]|jgi:putative ABC transport system ATP-binding protein|nr:ABC transporter ATP-binding protein [Bacillota bacterium]MDD4337229.1 ABC transporter ATP-binding protein [Bacillota bacterium]MDD4793118.1 ABC transporter ATP-binding protein [Bacillota bacterium]
MSKSGQDQAFIRLEDVSKVYQMGDVSVAALGGISLEISRGEHTAIMGPSGSGKSTLLNIMGGLDVATSGRYLLEGVEVTRLPDAELARIRCRHFGFVFQSYNLFPELSAIENVIVPMIYAGEALAHRTERAAQLLDSLGMGHRLRHLPSQLSGGEQQRVAIARALANDPDVIFADEPTGNLATAQGQEILDILEGLNKRGVTIVMVTHSESVASRAGRLITMRDGKIHSDQAAVTKA